ncbi:type II CAAX prenyl endopeptidase Rce1 family protein [Shouchella miscanthi]|uniref:CAAX prenyl protease 2/Lysostaphin resistance protein A-like domain-containing protein n=1 Tax=Shouchella miscanthi TaxID=2598861 RepID=A0ABU6NMQ3_9BACI|nr:CPBP family glutamic-type intramembrane protease [Shouchella miscanthi]MED4129456.1 hypothetical protein [Shouchella miscanthi]
MPTKQKVSLFIIVVLLLLCFILDEHSVLILLLGLSFPLCIMAVGPYIYPLLRTGSQTRFYVLTISLFIPALITSNNIIWASDNASHFLVAALGSILLLSLQIKGIIKSIRVSSLFPKMTFAVYTRQVLNITFLTFGEEVLFRAFFMKQIPSINGFEYLICGFVFSFYHYFNRYAKNIYTVKDYNYQFLLAVWLAVCFEMFNHSIMPVIFGHLVYNSTNYIVYTVQLLNHKQVDQ